MRKMVFPCLVVAVCAATSVIGGASATRLHVAAANQIYAQKSAMCSTSTFNVTASATAGVIVTNAPAACMGQSITVRLYGGLLGNPGIVVKGTISGSTVTLPNATLQALIASVGALAGVRVEVLVNGWSMNAVWTGVTL